MFLFIMKKHVYCSPCGKFFHSIFETLGCDFTTYGIDCFKEMNDNPFTKITLLVLAHKIATMKNELTFGGTPHLLKVRSWMTPHFFQQQFCNFHRIDRSRRIFFYKFRKVVTVAVNVFYKIDKIYIAVKGKI